MMQVVTLMSLLGCAAAVITTGPTCCMPDQWEGRQYSVYTEVNGGYSTIVHINSEIVYDATNEREKHVVKRTIDGILTFSDVYIYFYHLKLYGRERKNELCGAFPICVPGFQFHCMSFHIEDTEHQLAFNKVIDDSVNYGNETHPLTTTRHEYLTNSGGDLIYGTVTLTDDCIPVVEQKHVYVDGELRTKSSEFFDIVTGISAGAFDIPAACQHAPVTKSKAESIIDNLFSSLW